MGYKVAIDSGHGSNTSGKRSPDGYREHYSNTAIANYLNTILVKNGFETYKSSWNDDNSKDDIDVPLGTRQSNIKRAGCNISISIHANAHGSGSQYTTANGIETYYHSISAGDSKRLAELVHAELIKGTKQINRGIKTAEFAMCNCAAMGVKAAILIETAFMTNKAEADLLKSDLFMRECAKEIAQGIFKYFGVSGNINVIDTSSKPTTNTNIVAGKAVSLNNVPCYVNSTITESKSNKTGTFYLWSNEVVNNRVKITTTKDRVGVQGQVTGWIAANDVR